jgi:hypothetical protein
MNTTATVETVTEPAEPHWLSRSAFPVLAVLFFLTQASLAMALYWSNYWLVVPLERILTFYASGGSST